MEHVLPSDLVRIIEEEFPATLGVSNDNRAAGPESLRAAWVIPGILELIREIPQAFMTFDSQKRTLFVISIVLLQQAAELAQRTQSGLGWPSLRDNTRCLAFVRRVLHNCPDQVPSKASKGLLFLKDTEFRTTLLIDLGSAERALTQGEWKVAIVLTGSIIEALLLWAIQKHDEPKRMLAMERAVEKGRLSKILQAKDLTSWEWGLHLYIEVAYELGEIKEHTANPCREAKYYRNLIHPAAAERDKEQCTRGKAHGALGAVYSTIEDLEMNHHANGTTGQ